jgi:hypothetical protein
MHASQVDDFTVVAQVAPPGPVGFDPEPAVDLPPARAQGTMERSRMGVQMPADAIHPYRASADPHDVSSGDRVQRAY